MPRLGIFHKNKRVVGFRKGRILSAMFLLIAISLPLLNGLTRAADVPVKSVEITSGHTSYTNNEMGSWHITKSAEWIDVGKARVTFEVNSVAKYEEGVDLDVLLVIDNSGSMTGDKISRVIEDATSLIDTLLDNPNNRVALVSFNSEASIISGFTNNKTNMLDNINRLTTTDATNYNQGYIKALEVLDGYTQRENTNLVMLFLTDGAPNEEVPNEIAQYKTLKERYPYMVINGIQYEMGDTILQPIINVSDYQYIATMNSLNNVLFTATVNPYIYNNFVITDYIDNNYWNIEGVDMIKASLGTVELEYEGSTPKITWDMSGLYRSGAATQTLTIDINLKDELINDSLLLPTNTHETIESALKDTSDEDTNSDLTPKLKTTYDVIYDANSPSDCEAQGVVPETTTHTVFTTVEISDNKLSCSGYDFRGWQSDINESNKINDDYFKMPERDVIFKAIWSKPSILKSMDGKMHVMAPATFDTGENVNVKLKKLSGQSSASYSTANTTITAIEKADTLSTMVDKNDDAYIISAPDSIEPIYAWYNDGTIYYYTDGGNVRLNEDASHMFRRMQNLTSIDGMADWDTSSVTDMYYMFASVGYKATSFELDLSGWDTSSVTDMGYMFTDAGYNAASFELDLSGWDTSSVTYMDYMFNNAGYNATSWSVRGLSGWDTSSVTDMGYMFNSAGCHAANFELDLSGWDTSSATNMNYMFRSTGYYATNFELDLSGWNTSSVTNMNYMLQRAGYSATSWSVGDLSGWNTSSVTNMRSMFASAGYKATSFELDLSGWDTSSVTDTYDMFYETGYSATSWSIGDLSDWDTSSVTNMGYIFRSAGYSATDWSIGDLSGWNTSSVTNMSSVFASAGYNATSWSVGDLSGWDTSSVTSMNSMFNSAGYSATSFELDLSGWDTSSVTDMSSMFRGAGYNATSWSIGDLSDWDTSSVKYMRSMFNIAGCYATSFKLDLSGWDTSSVTNMSFMFASAGYSATDWSVGDLSGWDTSSVTNMSSMLKGVAYNATSWPLGNISGWDVSKVTDMSYMFANAGYNIADLKIDLSGWNASSVTNMNAMFNSTGHDAINVELDLSGWNTSSVTDMSYMFNSAGINATNVELDLSGWNTSSVTNMYAMFVVYSYTNWSAKISATNGSGITNTTTRMYGETTSVYVDSPSGRTFILVTTP